MQTIRDTDTFSAALRSRIAGRVIGPDDADYDLMRAVMDGTVDGRPGAIALAADADDVAAGRVRQLPGR